MRLDIPIYLIINVVFILLISPLFMSIIKKVKAWTQGRRGPPFMQTYYMIWKLLRKETVYSTNSSWIMRATPYICLMVMLVAALFVPVVFIPPAIDGIGNVILFLYLLALARFFIALSGLDAGSTFGGMGSSREMTISAIIEPVSMVMMVALAFTSGSLNFFTIFKGTSASDAVVYNPVLMLISIALFIVLIVETSRIPIDNPETHLELTMVHEAMILEQSGKNLAMLETSHAVKQTLFMAILINVLFPWGLADGLTWSGVGFSMGVFMLKMAVLAVAVGLVESSMAKARLFRIPVLMATVFLFSMLTIFIAVLS